MHRKHYCHSLQRHYQTNLYYAGDYVAKDITKSRKYYKEGIEQGDDGLWKGMAHTYIDDHVDNWSKCYRSYFSGSRFKQSSSDDKVLDVNIFLLELQFISVAHQTGEVKKDEMLRMLITIAEREDFREDLFDALINQLFRGKREGGRGIVEHCLQMLRKTLGEQEIEDDEQICTGPLFHFCHIYPKQLDMPAVITYQYSPIV